MSEGGILSGLRVLDIAHQYSGALAATLLGDLGAAVVSIEHPDGSPIQTRSPIVSRARRPTCSPYLQERKPARDEPVVAH